MQNRTIVFVLIVALVAIIGYGIYMKTSSPKTPAQGENSSPAKANTESASSSAVSGDTWPTTPADGLHVAYNPAWTVRPLTYRSPAAEREGRPAEVVGYTFSVPKSNAVISWGGPQNDCTASTYGTFVRGTSVQACVKGMRAELGFSAQGYVTSSADKQAFADFVEANK